MKSRAIQAPHEGFDVVNTSAPMRKKVIRQERITPPMETCYVTLGESELEVLNYTPFGIAVVAPLALPANQEFAEAAVTYNQTEIGKHHVRVTRCKESGGEFLIGLEVIGEPINTILIDAIEKSREVIEYQKQEIERGATVPGLFKQKVLEVKEWLEFLQKQVDALEQSLDWESGEVHELRDSIAQIIGNHLSQQFPMMYEGLRGQLLGLSSDRLRASIEYFRDKLKHLIYKSPLADRAFKKPLGYAGDYQMMNIVYDNQNGGNSLFAKCIHRYFIDVPATRAVRNRARFLKERLAQRLRKAGKNELVKILSVASGPAKEIEILMQEEPELLSCNADISLLDQDQSALQNAQRRIGRQMRKLKTNIKFNFLHQAMKNVIVKGLPDRGYNFIYSAGLFDYFTDPVAIMAASKLMDALAEGGTLIIGNFNTENPSQMMMELVMDWDLIYRSPEDLKRLFGGLGSEFAIEREPEGINLFCVITK